MEYRRKIIPFFFLLLSFTVSSTFAQGTFPGVTNTDSLEENRITLPTPLTREAIRDVLSGLSDTQVRELLLDELDNKVALRENSLKSNEQQTTSSILSGWATVLAKRFRTTVLAIPRIPITIENAVRKLSIKREEYNFFRIPATLLISILTGILLAYSISWLVRDQRTKLHDRPPTGLWSQIGIISVRFLFHGLQLLLFVFAAQLTNSIINNNYRVDESIVRYIITAISWTWFAVIVARFVLSPSQPKLRLCAVDDKTARFLTWRTGLIFGWSAFVFGFLLLFREINGSLGDARIGFWVKLVFYALIALTFWQAHKGITQIIIGRDSDISRSWRRFAEFWPIIAISLVFIQWVIAELIVATGNLNKISPSTLQLSIVILMVLPVVELAIRALVQTTWPVKSQGVMAMEDSAMIMRVKFTTKPGDQFIVRRFVLDEIRKLFTRKGIRFASREVTVRMAENDINSSMTEGQKLSIAAASRAIIDQQEQGSTASKPSDDR